MELLSMISYLGALLIISSNRWNRWQIIQPSLCLEMISIASSFSCFPQDFHHFKLNSDSYQLIPWAFRFWCILLVMQEVLSHAAENFGSWSICHSIIVLWVTTGVLTYCCIINLQLCSISKDNVHNVINVSSSHNPFSHFPLSNNLHSSYLHL